MADQTRDPFGARTTVDLPEGPTSFYRLSQLEEEGVVDSLDRLPFSIRVLLENALRHAGGSYVSEDHVRAVSAWSPTNSGADVPVHAVTGRVAGFHRRSGRRGPGSHAGRPEGSRRGSGDESTRSFRPTWSSTTRSRSTTSASPTRSGSTSRRSSSGTESATRCSAGPRKRSTTSPWCRRARESSTRSTWSTSPRSSIAGKKTEAFLAYPDTLVGTDSHTTMVNGLGVVGWGVGGIEAEAVVSSGSRTTCSSPKSWA